jgi:hypothetical protein
MIFHITPGGNFEHYAAEQFETVLPGGNRFVAILPKGASASETPNAEESKCERVVLGTGGYRALCEEIARSEHVVFHGLSPTLFLELLERCPRSCVTAWVPWGYEVYNRVPRLLARTLQPLTSSLYPRVLFERRGILRLSKRLLGPLFPGKLITRLAHCYLSLCLPRHLVALRRFDYILYFIPEEVDLIRERGLSEARHLPFCYVSLEKTVGERFMQVRAEGRDILLGNSASLSNNHLDALEMLAELDLAGRRVVCPLSYGDAAYGRAVAEAGRRRFGRAFVPLLQFMPLEKYNAILGNCSVVVMNHNRQQAMGNIITALWLGAKVYLNEDTTVWKYLRRIGAKVRSIRRELRRDNPAALDPLPEEAVEKNREVLLREFSYDRVLARCRKAVEVILGEPAKR